MVSTRLLSAEDLLSRSETRLREERRKTAKLERMVEKAHVKMRDSSQSNYRMSASHSSLPALSAISASNSAASSSADEEGGNPGEIEALRRELEVSKRRREDDLDMYLKMATEIKRAVITSDT